MFRRRLVGLLLGAMLWTSSAMAQEQGAPRIEITYERALALARDQAPRLVTARAHVREAESQVDAASVWRFNPQVASAVGPRFGASDTSIDWSLGIQQWLEIGGQRSARIKAASADATANVARSEDTERLLLRDVSVAFVSVLYWEQRTRLAKENVRIAEAIKRVANQRHEVGDVGGLEESVAALAVVRARGEEDRSLASLTEAEGLLTAFLGVDANAELILRGELRQFGVSTESEPDLASRPDLRALRADIHQAEAEAEIGRRNQVPNLGIGASYSREESADIVQGALTISIPIFDRGQGITAVAEARRDRHRAELSAAQARAGVEAKTAAAVAHRLREAAHRFEGGLSTLERTERLVAESYKAGAIPLGELLAVRRELVEAKRDYADLLLRAAVAHADLNAKRGTFP